MPATFLHPSLAAASYPLLTTIAAAFAAAWVLGLITQRLGLSPIVGYLLAGVVIGPHTPGFVGDIALAAELAEIGVILLMFGVGLHFRLRDLLAVRKIAVPGAIGQSLAAALLGMLIFSQLGMSALSGLMLGMAMAVASTVVLLRVLMDRDMLGSVHGHVAVGWLIVEDILTVLVLVMVPVIGGWTGTGEAAGGGGAGPAGVMAIVWAIAKLGALVAIVFLAGSRFVPWVLTQVARLRSHELFTLTVLVLSVTIAVGSAVFFGASVALGAFLAGMVVAQSPVSHQAAADALPMRDAFAVLFFVSVGMLFDPSFLFTHPWLVAAGTAIVLLAKPAAAIVIVAALGYSARTALTVAIGLAQIGEFSFILSSVAREHRLMSDDGHNVLVACAMISITINPLLFGRLDRIEGWLRGWPWAWRLLNARADRRVAGMNADAAAKIAQSSAPLALIVGYGPVGRVVDALLRDAGLHTVIIEMNLDTVQQLNRAKRSAIFGDATRAEVLRDAGITRAAHLVVTLPHSADRHALVLAARELNPSIEITVRARYLREQPALRAAGANAAIFEEGEAGVALARHIMHRRGIEPAKIDKLLTAIRTVWHLEP
ncbi:MAG: cation:proton antiporter [Phycisphaerales bacterium]